MDIPAVTQSGVLIVVGVRPPIGEPDGRPLIPPVAREVGLPGVGDVIGTFGVYPPVGGSTEVEEKKVVVEVKGEGGSNLLEELMKVFRLVTDPSVLNYHPLSMTNV